MIKILDNIFGERLEELGYEIKYIGNVIYIKLDDDRRIELTFYNTWSRDNYDSIRLRLVHKTDGNKHGQTVDFTDIFDSIRDLSHPNKIGKHVWHNGGVYRWYGKPTIEDIEAMQDVVVNYIELWK